uniref:Uncharacterized protein LOC104237292 n=1 Tax=Nicotiana sylvestris TaxID=4096 RepID=A0A1U7XTA7_NICSY|nr:PREDICTED: uncharacterized protein LOC104237292 [Nicotiana sylvestris]
MTVSQYEARFSKLARYASWIVLTDRVRIKRFVDGFNYHLRILMTRERVLGISFEDVVDIARDIETARRQEREEREAKRPRVFGSFSGASLMGQFQQGRGRSFRPAQSARPEYRDGSSGRGYQGSQQSQPSLSALPA